MKYKKDIILILIPAFLILVLIGFKSFDKNSFDLSEDEVHDISLKQEHILSISDLKTKLRSEEKIILIDLREQNIFEAKHLAKAINIPIQKLLERAVFEEYTNKHNSVVLYSKSVDETAIVWIVLTQMGYENIYILDITNDLISEAIFEKETYLLDDEVLKYKFQPDTTIKLNYKF